jgi:hypothetical protein
VADGQLDSAIFDRLVGFEITRDGGDEKGRMKAGLFQVLAFSAVRNGG